MQKFKSAQSSCPSSSGVMAQSRDTVNKEK
jgi:hypothetical protein